jgi:hypothetical protein
VTASSSVAVAAVFVWLGMVLAISFLEAPLKFRAPGVTVQLGLAIGRLVFRALYTVESALAAIVLLALLIDVATIPVLVAALVAVGALIAQVVGVRWWLHRRSDAVLAGDVAGTRSRGHFAYVALEVIKAGALLATGILLLAAQ